MARGGGEKKVKVEYEAVTVKIPVGLYEEVVRIMQSERRWFDRQQFVMEAIKEKVDRWKSAGHEAAAGPGPARFGEEVTGSGRKERRSPSP